MNDVEDLISDGCRLTVPTLLNPTRPDVVYRVADRQGVSVIAVPSNALSESELEALLTFVFAQYLAAGFVDRDVASRRRMRHEPLEAVDPETVQLIAVSTGDGLLLASLAVQAILAPRPAPRLSSRDRPLLPVEDHFGWGVFNRFAFLPDMPIDRIREFGRFVRNSRLGPRNGLGIRAVVEIGYAISRMLMGPLRMTVDAIVGEFEDHGGRVNLEFFHVPLAVVRGGLPVFTGEHYLQPALTEHDRHAFAVLMADLGPMSERLEAVERALCLPGDHVLAALLALQKIPSRAASTLVPVAGVPTLCDTRLRQSEWTVQARRAARARGARLQSFRPLATLSDLEATTLGTLLEVRNVAVGEQVTVSGEPSGGLVMVEHGSVDWLEEGRPGQILGEGDCFGFEGLLTGAPARATVVARRPTVLLCLSRDLYDRYLRELKDVELELHRLALRSISSPRHLGARRSNS